MRKEKTNYYLDIAQTVAERSTCLRRKFGCVIVNNDEIISTGYNGAPRGRINCDELQLCIRETMDIPRGERYEMCRSVHGEQNAVISAGRKDCLGGTLYIVGIDAITGHVEANVSSCMMCKRVIINSGISYVIARETENEYIIYDVEEWIKNDDIPFLSTGGDAYDSAIPENIPETAKELILRYRNQQPETFVVKS